jgi:hypothetical protein
LCQLEREGSYIMLYNALSFASADYERFRPLSRLFSGYKPLQPACFSCDVKVSLIALSVTSESTSRAESEFPRLHNDCKTWGQLARCTHPTSYGTYYY